MDAETTDMPIPKDGELQPDFAIRFHESMMDKIPNTEARTQRCFEVWRSTVGDEPEVATARRYHKSEEFQERRDIPVFEEHEIPSRKSKDGKRTIPAVKYDRKALAAICKNMNDAIEDVGKFCPITNGHTSDNRNDPEPEVLAYSGAYRLGMIGNKKPRYAIFADEYHRKDKEEILKGRRGRSVEVLPLPDVHSRSFYPIAALGADEPRLNLPPARYFNRPGENGEDIEVERYMMVAPGGNSTFIPSAGNDDRDKYGDEQELPQQLIRSVCEAIFASAPFQYVIGLMEQDGKSGSPTPLVHQAPPMADMPAEDPGMPGQPGQSQPGAPSPIAGADMNAGSDPAMQPPSQDAGGCDPSKPPFQKGNGTMPDEKDQYSKSAGLQALEARLQAIEAENASLKAKLIGSERYSKLSNLKAQGFEFDVQGELGRVATQTDEQFAAHCETIEKYYRKSPTAVADFSELLGTGRQNDLPSDNGIDELSAEDAKAVAKYSLREGIGYGAARDRYIAEKKTNKNAAG